MGFRPLDIGGKAKTVEIRHGEVGQVGPSGNVGFNIRGVGKDDIRHGGIRDPTDDPPRVAEMFKAQVVIM